MAWQYGQSQQRIRKLIEEAPIVDVRRFADEYLPLYESRKIELAKANKTTTPPLFDLPKGSAVTVGTVQIYIALSNYDQYRIEEGRETEASHKKALKFLHLYYSACDRVIQQTDAQRVDFHNGRMHAVVLDRSGEGNLFESLQKALSFVRDFRAVANEANRELANSDLDAEFRIGIDVGTCVAINNGTGLEQEPMFLGSPANHAAKLAQGEEPGVYLSSRARALLELPQTGLLGEFTRLDEDIFSTMIKARDEAFASDGPAQIGASQLVIEQWRDEIVAKSVPDPTSPDFIFHYKQPPLSEINFADLSPSNSIRMHLASLFADISGYTAYIDNAIATGGIAAAVRALYVMRQEFQNVVEDDFGGRKIRFIGDCIHAVIAEGSNTEIDAANTVTSSISCAGGLRSSFEICRAELEGIHELGLTIGIEFGPTPISRIGIRGDRSVRSASSIATATSEQVQRGCEKDQTKFGVEAQKWMTASLEHLVDEDGVANNLVYDDVVIGSSDTPAIVTAPVYARAHSPSEYEKPRAHLNFK